MFKKISNFYKKYKLSEQIDSLYFTAKTIEGSNITLNWGKLPFLKCIEKHLDFEQAKRDAIQEIMEEIESLEMQLDNLE